MTFRLIGGASYLLKILRNYETRNKIFLFSPPCYDEAQEKQILIELTSTKSNY